MYSSFILHTSSDHLQKLIKKHLTYWMWSGVGKCVSAYTSFNTRVIFKIIFSFHLRFHLFILPFWCAFGLYWLFFHFLSFSFLLSFFPQWKVWTHLIIYTILYTEKYWIQKVTITILRDHHKWEKKINYMVKKKEI